MNMCTALVITVMTVLLHLFQDRKFIILTSEFHRTSRRCQCPSSRRVGTVRTTVPEPRSTRALTLPSTNSKEIKSENILINIMVYKKQIFKIEQNALIACSGAFKVSEKDLFRKIYNRIRIQ